MDYVYVGEGVDYFSGPYMVMFEVGMTNGSFNVSIRDDNILESNEMFNLSIDASSLPSGISVGDIGVTTVTILDNDRK